MRPVSSARRWRFTWPWLLLLVFLLLALVVQAPAGLLNRIDSERLVILDATGSLWNGRGWLALRNEYPHAATRADGFRVVLPIAWNLNWSGGPVIDIQSMEGRGVVQLGLKGATIELSRIGFALERLPLPGALESVGPSGLARLESGKYFCSYRGACRGQARVFVAGLSLRMFPGEIIGDIGADISVQEGKVGSSLRIANPAAVSGSLELKGEGKGIPAIKGSLRGTEKASTQLKSALATLGRNGPEGVVIDIPPGG